MSRDGFRVTAAPSIGLALGAGASRGWAHIGVIRYLERHGIAPDVVCGTSAGALVGGFYAAGKLDFLEGWARDLTLSGMLRLLEVRPDRTLFGRKLLRLLAEQARAFAMEDLPVRFAAVATDLVSGRELRIDRGPLVKAVAASGAYPGLFPPVKIGRRWAIDGTLSSPVPVAACRALGADVVIAVNPTGSRSCDSVNGTAGLGSVETLSRIVPRGLARSLKLRGLRGCRTTRDRAGAPDPLSVTMRLASLLQDTRDSSGSRSADADVLVEPQRVPVIGAGQADRAIEAGYAAAESALADLAGGGAESASDSGGSGVAGTDAGSSACSLYPDGARRGVFA